jgi:hypothetical protein
MPVCATAVGKSVRVLPGVGKALRVLHCCESTVRVVQRLRRQLECYIYWQ